MIKDKPYLNLKMEKLSNQPILLPLVIKEPDIDKNVTPIHTSLKIRSNIYYNYLILPEAEVRSVIHKIVEKQQQGDSTFSKAEERLNSFIQKKLQVTRQESEKQQKPSRPQLCVDWKTNENYPFMKQKQVQHSPIGLHNNQSFEDNVKSSFKILKNSSSLIEKNQDQDLYISPTFLSSQPSSPVIHQNKVIKIPHEKHPRFYKFNLHLERLVRTRTDRKIIGENSHFLPQIQTDRTFVKRLEIKEQKSPNQIKRKDSNSSFEKIKKKSRSPVFRQQITQKSPLSNGILTLKRILNITQKSKNTNQVQELNEKLETIGYSNQQEEYKEWQREEEEIDPLTDYFNLKHIEEKD